MEQVEDLVDDRCRLAGPPGARRSPSANPRPILEEAEPRPPRLVERHDLTVHDRFPRLDPRRLAGELREIGRRIQATTRPDACLSVADDRLDAVPIPRGMGTASRR